MFNADILIQKMMVFYNVFTISELANVIGVSQPSISGWKRNNYIKAIANKCRELGIYNDIFGDFISNINNQTIGDNQGNLSQTGNVYTSKDNNELNNIDEAALSTFKRAYSKCVDDNGDVIEDKLDELIIYLTKFK